MDFRYDELMWKKMTNIMNQFGTFIVEYKLRIMLFISHIINSRVIAQIQKLIVKFELKYLIDVV